MLYFFPANTAFLKNARLNPRVKCRVLRRGGQSGGCLFTAAAEVNLGHYLLLLSHTGYQRRLPPPPLTSLLQEAQGQPLPHVHLHRYRHSWALRFRTFRKEAIVLKLYTLGEGGCAGKESAQLVHTLPLCTHTSDSSCHKNPVEPITAQLAWQINPLLTLSSQSLGTKSVLMNNNTQSMSLFFFRFMLRQQREEREEGGMDGATERRLLEH